MSTPSQLPKVGNEQTNTAEGSSNQRSQGATTSPADLARAVWQSRTRASQSTTANTVITSQGRRTATPGFQPSTPNTQINSEGLQETNTSRTEQNVLQASNSAEPGATSTSSYSHQNIGTASQSNDSATIHSVMEDGVDFGPQIQTLRITESDVQLRNTDIHLAPVTNIHRDEDGLVVIRITSSDRERPAIMTFRNIRPSEAVDVSFIRGDTTQVEPQVVNNGVSQVSEASSLIIQPIPSSQEAVVDESIIPSRSLGPDHTSVDGAEGVEVILPDRTSRPYELSFNRDRQADTISGTITIASPNAQGEEGPQCSICFEILTTRSTLMPCGHEFDANCIIPWFKTVLRAEPWRRTLDCPLCRRSTLQMRHAYNPQGEYQIFDIHERFRRRYDPQRWIWPVPNSPSVPRPRPDSGHNVASPGDLDSTYSRVRYVLGQYRAFIIESEHPHRLFLDMAAINRMGPHELEDLFFDLRNHLSDADWNRFPESQTRMLVQRICTFRGLSSDGPFERVNHFPGYNSDDSLNINELSRRSRRYLAKFRYVLNDLWELDRLSDSDVEAFSEYVKMRDSEMFVGMETVGMEAWLYLKESGSGIDLMDRKEHS